MKFELLKGSRSRILAGIILVMAVLFVGRLFQLQVIQYSHYKSLADQSQIKQRVIPAERGLIYTLDDGEPEQLVYNQTVYTVFADPVMVKDGDAVIEAIKSIAGGNARPDLKALLARKETRYQILATKVTRTQVEKLKAADLQGIGFQAVSQRYYPEGALAGQVLGFVDADGNGRYGLEGGLDEALKGKDGLLKSVTDVADVPLTLGDQNIDQPAEQGKNVVLSIDRNIQAKVEQALLAGQERTGATYVSAVVMDPNNGQVMAMANLPSYNPGSYNTVTDAATFNNRVISNPYEPGSDIKTFTMATGVDKGVVRSTDTYVNTDQIKVDDITIWNYTRGHTGTITFQTALNWSLNTGFVTVAQRLGDGKNITRNARDTMYDYFHNKFRLGELTGIELAGEQKGMVIPPTETEGNAVRYSNMAFGQGMTATMLQVTAGFGSIVNGGKYYKPTIIAGEIDKNGDYQPVSAPSPVGTTISESTSQHMREMIVSSRQGNFPGIDKPGYQVGGKTGTSQVAVPGGYSTTDTIASYVGFGGGSRSNYVIMVEVSADGRSMQGARDAMPIFTDISNWLLDYLKVVPNS